MTPSVLVFKCIDVFMLKDSVTVAPYKTATFKAILVCFCSNDIGNFAERPSQKSQLFMVYPFWHHVMLLLGIKK